MTTEAEVREELREQGELIPLQIELVKLQRHLI